MRNLPKRQVNCMNVGGIFLVAVIVITALGVINSSVKARKKKESDSKDQQP